MILRSESVQQGHAGYAIPSGRGSLVSLGCSCGGWYEHVLVAGDWWIGLSPDDLEVAGNGALGSVLALEDVGRRRVLPLVESHLDSLATRLDLIWLLRLPAAVVDQVTPEAAAKSAWSIAQSDPWLGRFLEHLRDAAGRRALVAERDQARQDLREAEDKVVRAREAVRAAEERVERLKERVADSHEQSAGLRASNARQASLTRCGHSHSLLSPWRVGPDGSPPSSSSLAYSRHSGGKASSAPAHPVMSCRSIRRATTLVSSLLPLVHLWLSPVPAINGARPMRSFSSSRR